MQLQAEVDQYRLQNPVENKEVVRLMIHFTSSFIDVLPNRKKKRKEKGRGLNGTRLWKKLQNIKPKYAFLIFNLIATITNLYLAIGTYHHVGHKGQRNDVP